MIERLLLAHPRAVGESYFQHQRYALGYAGALLVAALACAVHALIPGVCVKTASRTVVRLQTEMGRRGGDTDRATVPAE